MKERSCRTFHPGYATWYRGFATHSKRTVHTNETFDFLKDIVAKVPDPVETDSNANAAAGDNRGGKRRKTAKNADESD